MDKTQTPKSAFEETIESLKAKAASARTPEGITVSITDLTDPKLTHHLVSSDGGNPEGAAIPCDPDAEDVEYNGWASEWPIVVKYDPNGTWRSSPGKDGGEYFVQTLSELESAVSYMLDHPEAFRKREGDDLLSLVFGAL